MLDPAERERMILSLKPRVEAAASFTVRRFPSFFQTIHLDDLRAEAWGGAIYAVDHFDPARGMKLTSFAERRIRGAIMDYLRRQSWWKPRSKRKREKEAGVYQYNAPIDIEPLMRTLAAISDAQPDHLAERADWEQQAHEAIARGIRKLSPLQSEVLTALFYRDMEAREVAQSRGCTAGNVWSARSKGLRRLGEYLLRRESNIFVQGCCNCK